MPLISFSCIKYVIHRCTTCMTHHHHLHDSCKLYYLKASSLSALVRCSFTSCMYVCCMLERAARLIALHQICQSTWLVPSKLIICRRSWNDQGRLLQHCLPASSTGLRHNVYERARETTGNLSAYAVVLGHRLNLWSLSLYTVLPETHSSPLWKVLTSKLSSNKSASFIPSKVLHI